MHIFLRETTPYFISLKLIVNQSVILLASFKYMETDFAGYQWWVFFSAFTHVILFHAKLCIGVETFVTIA